MAAYLGLSRGHISDLERGTREIGLLTMQVITKGLDTTMAKLLKGLWLAVEVEELPGLRRQTVRKYRPDSPPQSVVVKFLDVL